MSQNCGCPSSLPSLLSISLLSLGVGWESGIEGLAAQFWVDSEVKIGLWRVVTAALKNSTDDDIRTHHTVYI